MLLFSQKKSYIYLYLIVIICIFAVYLIVHRFLTICNTKKVKYENKERRFECEKQ